MIAVPARLPARFPFPAAFLPCCFTALLPSIQQRQQ